MTKTSKLEFEKTSVLAQKIIETKNDKYIFLANSASADTKWQNRKFLEEKENESSLVTKSKNNSLEDAKKLKTHNTTCFER